MSPNHRATVFRMPTSATLASGGLAGAAGALAVAGLARLRDRALGRPPPYAAPALVRALAANVAWTPSARATRVGGELLRLAYGTTLGVLFSALGGRHAAWGGRGAGWVLGATVLLGEHVAFPRLGLTPPASHWTRGERSLLAVQTLLFGQTVAWVYRRAARARHATDVFMA
ncbi:hypothetical protein [Myxococcus sp. Y35]|uniref:hypothetical protein n=1 Tax=Pseudomyxococcus flavus TaxID=3115648 RepID=UPI003CF18912